MHAVAIDRETTVRAHKSHLARSGQCPNQSECHCDQDNTTGSADGDPLPKAQVFGPGDEAKDPPPYATREKDKEGRLYEGGYRFPIQTSSAGLRKAQPPLCDGPRREAENDRHRNGPHEVQKKPVGSSNQVSAVPGDEVRSSSAHVHCAVDAEASGRHGAAYRRRSVHREFGFDFHRDVAGLAGCGACRQSHTVRGGAQRCPGNDDSDHMTFAVCRPDLRPLIKSKPSVKRVGSPRKIHRHAPESHTGTPGLPIIYQGVAVNAHGSVDGRTPRGHGAAGLGCAGLSRGWDDIGGSCRVHPLGSGLRGEPRPAGRIPVLAMLNIVDADWPLIRDASSVTSHE